MSAPSWKPGDEPATPAQNPQAFTPEQSTTPVYQSYSQGAPTVPQPVQPAMPPSGQRPKPGTPEYEEMARRAMEEQLRGTSASAPADTSPLSTPQFTDTTSVYGYVPEPVPQPAPPVQPAMPPPGQRPKPGTPEYEEMARRAMDQRGVPSANTSPLGSVSQPAQPVYTPEPTPQPAPPVQPAMAPPGQRPKPGTPEYEEMARRAMEERQKQREGS
jgi:hypothetical protein